MPNGLGNRMLQDPRRGGLREFFRSLGFGLLAIVAYFYVFSAAMPTFVLYYVGGFGCTLLVLGLIWPAAKPLTYAEVLNREVVSDEAELYSGPASHLSGWENRAGVLNLTSQRLAFFSHGMNVRNADLVVPLAEVVAVEPANTLGIIPNAFRIRTTAGATHQFTVFGRQAWMGKMRAASAARR